MNCAECQAFRVNYRLAAELYAEATKKLFNMVGVKEFYSPEFQRQKMETLTARHECMGTKEALRIHRESHAP